MSPAVSSPTPNDAVITNYNQNLHIDDEIFDAPDGIARINCGENKLEYVRR